MAKPPGSPPVVAVILLSYNRPKMLQMAYDSIKDENLIILVDDGSDTFDTAAWARSHPRIVSEVIGPKKSVDERLSKPSLGKLINRAVRRAVDRYGAEIITYLCDDDLFAPGWIPALRAALHTPNGPHICRGRWMAFDDPLTGDPILPKDAKNLRAWKLDWRQMTTGNFGHRAECYREGLQWSEETVGVHDDTFLWNMHRIHDLRESRNVIHLQSRAGYRRLHSFNMALYTVGDRYGIGADKALAHGALE
jgi:glycosyltransferase involved in cell wall biosynthesis